MGNDCNIRTCPLGKAWIGDVVKANDLHPMAECSNMGDCDRKTGVCDCYNQRDGIACERATCPEACSNQGVCYTQKQIAEEAGRIYTTPWDANKVVGCVCDLGFRGIKCDQ